MARHLGDLLHETRQTKARIKEGNCSRHIESWGAGSEVARQDRALSGKQKAPIDLAVGVSGQLLAVRCLSRRGRLLSGSNER